MIKTHRHSAAAVSLLLLAASNASADVLFVSIAASGAGTGTSWSDAFTDLKSALQAASAGDEVWVARGTYLPGAPGDTTAAFTLKTGVQVLGGFAGGEMYRSQRDPAAHETILSGDLGQDDTFGSGAWYVGWNMHTANSDHVVLAENVDSTAVLDGFTVRGGSAASTSHPGGGGMFIHNASPTIRDCVFFRNLAGFNYGGGIFALDSSPTISGCTFHQNWVHLGQGGGFCAYGPGTVTVLDCTFTENYCNSGAGGAEGQGAGVSIWTATSATIDRCTFRLNQASQFNGAGGYELARGGGLSSFLTPLTLRDCVFSSNSAPSGGGISLWSATTIINCSFWDNLCYETTLSNGSAGGSGGGMVFNSYQAVDATLINCVFARNRGFEAAGFESFNSARAVLRNCIVWGNIGANPEVGPRRWQFKGSHSIQYSCVMDLLTADPGEDPVDPAKYPGCIIIDPLLANIVTGDLRLTAPSPCIDAARNSHVPSGVATDLAHLARFFDEPAKADTGVGPPPIVDMGAHEFGSSPCSPSITTQPTDQAVCPGGSAQFTVTATGASSYQWRHDTIAIPGATFATLSLAATSPKDGGPYDCVITNPCGSVTSTIASLTLDNCCPADFDGSGFVDTDDFDAFVQAFEAGTDDADFDDSGFVDTDDFDAFVLAFEAGC